MPPDDQTQTVEAGLESQSPSVDPNAGTTSQEPGGAPLDTDTSTLTPDTQSSGEEPTDLLSAVRSALKSPADPSPAAGSSAGTPEAQSGTGETVPQTDATLPELTPADFADVEKPSVHKRVERLFADRAAARAEVQTLREPADNWGRHVEFLRQNNVTPDDAQALYSVAQLIGQGHWRNAAEAIRPYYELCLKQLGEILPEDLQRRVDEGSLAAENAHEIARARGDASQAQTRATYVETRRAQDADQSRVTAVRSALSAWEQNLAARDPDFALKRDAVNAHAKAIVADRGLPPDESTAVTWANEAYNAVHRLFQAARPQSRSTQPRPSSVAPAAKTTPEPRSLREAVEMALRG